MATVKYSGPIASFRCPTNAEIRSLKVHFSPKQEGSGDPSPENIRPIVGWDGVDTSDVRKNLFDYTNMTRVDNHYYNDDGQYDTSDISGFFEEYILVQPSTHYMISGSIRSAVYCYDRNKQWIRKRGATNSPREFITPADCYYIRIQYRVSDVDPSDIQIEQTPKTYPSSYESYKGWSKSLTWPEIGAIYGGYVDLVTGELVSTWGSLDLGTLSWFTQSYENAEWFRATLPTDVWQNTWIPDVTVSLNNYPPHFLIDRFKIVSGSSIYYNTSGDNALGMDWRSTIRIKCDSYEQDATVFQAAMNGVILYYEYAAPATYQLTPMQLETFIGQNNVWSNADYVEVEYDLHETQNILARK